jgi:hypothetical protein
MKFLLTVLLAGILHTASAQTGSQPMLKPGIAVDSHLYEIRLSDSLQSGKMGVWQNGDYQIWVNIEAMETSFRKDYDDLMNAINTQYKNDTLTSARIQMYAARYLRAADQLKAAKHGFDLKSLVVYIGPENEIQNQGNSSTVHIMVRQSLENGKAIVYFQGKRIFSLKKLILSDYMMSTIWIYKDVRENSAYVFNGHINW